MRLNAWTALVCLSRVFLFATFMTVAATIPLLQEAWGISATEAGAVGTAFTIAYAASLFGFSLAADRFGARRIAEISAAASAIASAAFGLFARDFTSTLVLYALVGLCQGGTYTALVMVFSDRVAASRRGAAMGWLIASTSVGYAFSLAVSGAAIPLGGWRAAFLATGLLPALGALLLIACLRRTENRVHPRGLETRLSAALARNREARLLTLGYVAHSWELLGSWLWMPAFLAAAFALSGADLGAASERSAWSTAFMHLVGAGAAFSIGSLSDRLGRRRVLIAVAALAAALTLSVGWMIALPPLLLVGLAVAQAFTTIGDSPVLTTALTEATPPGALGAVLAVRSLLGFGAGAAAPLAAGMVLDAAHAQSAAPAVAWGLAFGLLGLGGLGAAFCAARLRDGRRAA